MKAKIICPHCQYEMEEPFSNCPSCAKITGFSVDCHGTLYYDHPAFGQESILVEAERITSTDRQKDYGHPADDFARVATAFNALTGHSLKPADIPVLMICMKLSREHNRPKRDNRVDIAGYAKCLDQTVEKLG